MSPTSSSMVDPWERSTPQERDAITEIGACVYSFEEGIGRDFRDRCDHFYKLYRGFKEFRSAWEAAGPNDRDVTLKDAKATWGANLHIPYTFATVETMVPRAISQRPRMLILPTQQRFAENAANMRALVDRQQEQIDSELTWQSIMRSGMIYGLGAGKGLALDTPLPTPDGWTTMGEVQAGDELLDESGRSCRVQWTSQVNHVPCFRVEFDDGASVVCDADHLWTTLGLTDRKRIGEAGGNVDWRDYWDRAETADMLQLATRFKAASGQLWHTVPNARPLDLPERDLPIDPYVLGAWLGDGTAIHGAITSADPEIIEEIERRGQPAKVRASTAMKSAPCYQLAGLVGDLREVGVLGAKRIPSEYLRASKEQRLALLRGLMDTDGTHDRHGTVSITQCNAALTGDIKELVCSLGWKATIHEGPTNGPWATDGGWRQTVYFTPDECPFLLGRKARRWVPSTQAIRATGRRIKDIVLVPSVPTRCLSVDTPRSLFLAGEDMIPTHNSFWRKEFAHKRYVLPRLLGVRWPGQSPYYVSQPKQVCVFDDPDQEDIDIYDLMWDPYGFDVRSCGWMAHRLWFGTAEVQYRLQSGVWNTASAQALKDEPATVLEAMRSSNQRHDEIWQQRMLASGLASYNLIRSEGLHEVIEYHDGQRVLTLLDRQVLVQDAENPMGGHLPFQVYRPTPLQKQMVGIGEIEPIEDLNRQLDTLESQMVDAGTIALCAGYAYDDAAIDEEDLVFGPASAIRVTNANPRDALWPIPKADIPASSFELSRSLANDIERMAGLNDALGDRDGSVVSTATEAQLVAASLSKRVQLKSRRFEVEVVRQATRAFVGMNQRMILRDREHRMPPDPSMDQVEAANLGVWRYVTLGPGELAGDFEITEEGGSMAAENVPQMRQDAVQMGNMFGGNANVDQRILLLRQLELFGIRRPHEWLTTQEQPIPPIFLEILQRGGVPMETIAKAVTLAQHMQPALPPEQNQQAPA